VGDFPEELGSVTPQYWAREAKEALVAGAVDRTCKRI